MLFAIIFFPFVPPKLLTKTNTSTKNRLNITLGKHQDILLGMSFLGKFGLNVEDKSTHYLSKSDKTQINQWREADKSTEVNNQVY